MGESGNGQERYGENANLLASGSLVIEHWALLGISFDVSVWILWTRMGQVESISSIPINVTPSFQKSPGRLFLDSSHCTSLTPGL